MQSTFVRWTCCLLAQAAMGNSVTVIPHDDNLIRYEGRFQRMETGSAFDMPGSRLTVQFTDSEQIDMTLSQRMGEPFLPHRFWVYVDGALSDTIVDTRDMINNTWTRFNLASSLDSTRTYTVSLVKITEAQYDGRQPSPNYVMLSNLILDDGARLFPAPSSPRRRIEFIGDSITAGFCTLCDTVDPALGDYAKESFALSHADLTCSRLQASCHTAAWSGFGVVRNCCGGVTLMPEIYTRTLLSVPGSTWDFTQWIPDVVVVNLGTNDNLNSADPGETERSYVREYARLLRNIRGSYPAATLFAACGPMSYAYCPFVAEAIAMLSEEAIAVTAVTYGPMSSACCNHPSGAAQENMASELSMKIASVMGWDVPSL
jgi:hypothetical protein